jgi:hypothetical protein
MWLKKLKVAVVEENTSSFEKLFKDIPKLQDPREIEEALYLIEAAKKIVVKLKDETQASMVQMKKNLAFLNSARADRKSRFDITS